MNDQPNANGVGGPLPAATAQSQEQWRQYCAQLLAEIDRLRALNDMLRQQRKELFDQVDPDGGRPTEFDEAEVLANLGASPTLSQLVDELQRSEGP